MYYDISMCVYDVFWSYSSLPTTPLPPKPLSTFRPPPPKLFILMTQWISFGLLQEYELQINTYTPEENVSLSPETVNCFGEWALLSLLSVCERVLMGPFLCRSSQLLWLGECDGDSRPGRQSSILLPSPLASIFPMFLLLQCSQSLRWGDIGALFMAEHPTVTYSQQLDKLWISGVSALYWERNILWSKLAATLIYRDEYKII